MSEVKWNEAASWLGILAEEMPENYHLGDLTLAQLVVTLADEVPLESLTDAQFIEACKIQLAHIYGIRYGNPV